MAELIWNINGKYFKDFGVFVSDSKGIMDEPNQKKTDTYDWAEYHGLASNLQSKPKYEAREFELACWVKGADWLEMRNNFDSFMSEFRNSGKQRLTLNIFGKKTYVWDVNSNGKVELKKQIQKGTQIGVFTIKLIEYNPIKKVLTISNPNLQLSFNSDKWVEVNIDGKSESLKGSVNINKTIPNRFLTNYGFNGRNYFGLMTTTQADGGVIVDERTNKSFHVLGIPDVNRTVRFKNTIRSTGKWTVSFEARGDYPSTFKIYSFDSPEMNVNVTAVMQKFQFTFDVTTHSDTVNYFDIIIGYANYYFDNFKVEKGNKATDWTPAPEDVHFISIAGNVEEITNLTTNADILWERL